MPYSEVSISGYNSNPPPDDGTATSDNEVSWSKHKTKIGDPLKTAIESTQTNITSVVDSIEADVAVLEGYFTSGVLDDANGGAGTIQGYFTAGVLGIANGGTGQSTAAEAIGELTQALTEDTTPDFTADFAAAYDASADTGKKIKLSTLLRPTSTSAPIGYAAGAGGTVTQGTSKSTGVTLSKLAGTITTNGASLSAATRVTFTVTNTLVAATDVIVLSMKSDHSYYLLFVDNITAGTFDITIQNLAATSQSDAIEINFVVIKGATT